MGACCCGGTEKVGPMEMGAVEGKETPEFSGPVKNRRPTDVFFAILMIVFFGVLIWLLIYCYNRGDVYRIINGYDEFGNICGRKNNFNIENCIAKDMTNYKYHSFTNINSRDIFDHTRQCVNQCEQGTRLFINRCIPDVRPGSNGNTLFSKSGVKNFLTEVSEDFELIWREQIYLALIAFGFSVVMLLLFRFLVGIVVWLVLIGVALASIAGTVYLWIMWKQIKDEEKMDTINVDVDKRSTTAHLVYAIVATVVTVIILLVLIVMRKRIKLVIQLFKEAGKAIGSMPFLLFEPILTFLALALFTTFWFVTSIVIESSGSFVCPGGGNQAFLEKDTIIQVARWYNLLGLFWIIQFCFGCQHMIIAGATSKWFFTRDKNNLGFPIVRSFSNLVFFHLGTVAFGSFIIALVQLVRAFLKFLEYSLNKYNNKCTNCILKCCQCCLWCFDRCLQFLSRNAYIETAIFGYNFCKGGQQAFKHLANNALRVAAINSVGDFVLFLGKALVVIATVLIGVEMIEKKPGLHHDWVPLVIAGIFAYLVSHCFITVYEMAIDTIFLCFCEDCELNDGLSRPYFMSRGLMQFVQDSKRAMAIESGQAKEAWSGNRVVPSVSGSIA